MFEQVQSIHIHTLTEMSLNWQPHPVFPYDQQDARTRYHSNPSKKQPDEWRMVWTVRSVWTPVVDGNKFILIKHTTHTQFYFRVGCSGDNSEQPGNKTLEFWTWHTAGCTNVSIRACDFPLFNDILMLSIFAPNSKYLPRVPYYCTFWYTFIRLLILVDTFVNLNLFLYIFHRNEETRQGNGAAELEAANQVQFWSPIVVQKWRTNYERCETRKIVSAL